MKRIFAWHVRNAIIVLLTALLFTLSARISYAYQDWQHRFELILAADVDGGRYQTSQLMINKEALTRLGISGDEAGEIVVAAIRAGISADVVQDFTSTAVRVAELHAISPMSALLRMKDGLLHGYAAVRNLDRDWNFLTAKEIEEIQALFDKGSAASAANKAFQALRRQSMGGH